ncbi:hypothetical protein C5S32_02990 [ANME-1 cluster archaeon GoMg1]|nr:hypothetical protein [ANME-1 cluster archaeon GoMg1]
MMERFTEIGKAPVASYNTVYVVRYTHPNCSAPQLCIQRERYMQ